MASEQEAPSSPARTTRTTMRPLSHLEILCAAHDCAVKQEPESLYYQTIAIDRPMKRPDPPSHRRVTKVKRAPVMTPLPIGKDSRHEPCSKSNETKSSRLYHQTKTATTTAQSCSRPRKTTAVVIFRYRLFRFKREVEKRAPPGCVGVPSFHKTGATKPREYETAKIAKPQTQPAKRNRGHARRNQH